MLWFLIISIYLYRTLLPEIVFINESGTRIEQIKIEVPDDVKIWRNIEHTKSKAFRYQPTGSGGEYKISVILADGTLVQNNFKGIEPWNLGHKVFIKLSADLTLSADYSYSLFE